MVSITIHLPALGKKAARRELVKKTRN